MARDERGREEQLLVQRSRPVPLGTDGLGCGLAASRRRRIVAGTGWRLRISRAEMMFDDATFI